MRLTRTASTAILCIGLLLSACSSPQDSGEGGIASDPDDGSPAAAEPIEGPVVIRLEDDIDTFDPHATAGAPGFFATLFPYDTLVGLDENNEPVPLLAEEWQAEPDHLSLTLRDDATCQDGTSVTASVVEASFARLLDPETQATHRNTVFGPGEVSIESDDDSNTLDISLSEPNSDLLTGLAHPAASIVCPNGLETPEDLATMPMGSGPFELVESNRGESYTFAARDDYDWGMNGHGTTSEGFPDTVILRVVTDGSTAANLFLTEEIDIVNLDGRELVRVRDEVPNAAEYEHVRQSINLFFNQSDGRVGGDPIVRRAVAMALDRTAYAEIATNQEGNTASSYVAPTTPGYDGDLTNAIPEFDPGAAEQLLVDNGWEKGDDGYFARDGQTLSLEFIVSSGRTPGGEFLLESLDSFGIEVDFRDVDFNTYLDTIFGDGDFDMSLIPLTAGNAPTPWYATAYFVGPAVPDGTNLTRASNDEAMEAVNAARQDVTEGRYDSWIEAQEVLFSNVDVVPMAYSPRSWLSREIAFDTTEYGNVYPPSLRPR